MFLEQQHLSKVKIIVRKLTESIIHCNSYRPHYSWQPFTSEIIWNLLNIFISHRKTKGMLKGRNKILLQKKQKWMEFSLVLQTSKNSLLAVCETSFIYLKCQFIFIRVWSMKFAFYIMSYPDTFGAGEFFKFKLTSPIFCGHYFDFVFYQCYCFEWLQPISARKLFYDINCTMFKAKLSIRFRLFNHTSMPDFVVGFSVQWKNEIVLKIKFIFKSNRL